MDSANAKQIFFLIEETNVFLVSSLTFSTTLARNVKLLILIVYFKIASKISNIRWSLSHAIETAFFI